MKELLELGFAELFPEAVAERALRVGEERGALGLGRVLDLVDHLQALAHLLGHDHVPVAWQRVMLVGPWQLAEPLREIVLRRVGKHRLRFAGGRGLFGCLTRKAG